MVGKYKKVVMQERSIEYLKLDTDLDKIPSCLEFSKDRQILEGELYGMDKPFSVFSNKGKLQQCDNALRAALSSSICIGASSKDGCVLMSYKNLGTTVNGPCLYQVDPSGSFKTVEVIAGGVEYDKARKFVERRLSGLDDNIATCFHALREYSGATINPEDISVGVFLSKTGEFKVYDMEGIKEIFESIEE
ncbi:unnamed protein product [Medioppia subpectinata]|uniref:Uncharacterized protein n=1 Tax=Medioppia subpectinata TaxID=1979941 RepID=A0A7R9KDJ7_9ACAR|nr:unnamed protein product [Medioppia subpectinata]CAG2101131.1 unnamed protein product [Medioppia subpectinata]